MHVMGPFLLSFVTWMFLFQPFKSGVELFIVLYHGSPFYQNLQGRTYDKPYKNPYFFVLNQKSDQVFAEVQIISWFWNSLMLKVWL